MKIPDIAVAEETKTSPVLVYRPKSERKQNGVPQRSACGES